MINKLIVIYSNNFSFIQSKQYYSSPIIIPYFFLSFLIHLPNCNVPAVNLIVVYTKTPVVAANNIFVLHSLYFPPSLVRPYIILAWPISRLRKRRLWSKSNPREHIIYIHTYTTYCIDVKCGPTLPTLSRTLVCNIHAQVYTMYLVYLVLHPYVLNSRRCVIGRSVSYSIQVNILLILSQCGMCE